MTAKGSPNGHGKYGNDRGGTGRGSATVGKGGGDKGGKATKGGKDGKGKGDKGGKSEKEEKQAKVKVTKVAKVIKDDQRSLARSAGKADMEPRSVTVATCDRSILVTVLQKRPPRWPSTGKV